MPTIIKKPSADGFKLPTGRTAPVTDPWQLAYLITGEKKVGKTSFAIEGAEEMVLQFDKPQLSYNIREVCPKDWNESMKAIKAMEALDDFKFDRIIIDGAGEWYQMAHTECCKHFGVEHPSEEGYARGWHRIRDNFLDAVNRLLRLQNKHGCGLMFIAHSEWKERKKGKETTEVLVPNLPSRCEEILNGKCDGWFNYGYNGSTRVLTIRGGETIAAGHRIDGHFLTPDGRKVDEIVMGDSAAEAMKAFVAAYNNKQTYVDFDEWRLAKKAAPTKPKVVVRRA